MSTNDTATEPARLSDPKALAALLAPIRVQLVLAVLLQIVSAVASLVPFIAVAEIGRTLLAAGPVDEDRLWAIVVWAAGGLLVRFVTLAAAGGITHFAEMCGCRCRYAGGWPPIWRRCRWAGSPTGRPGR